MTNYTEEQLALQSYIESQNNRFPDNPFKIVTDPEHWAEYGIYNIDQFERQMAINAYSDAYKEVYGMRPRMCLDEYSTEEIEAQTDSLYQTLEKMEDEPDYF